MKTLQTLKALLILATITIVSCDNNDDQQTTPATPTDGFTVSNSFKGTENAYITIDQADVDGGGFPDYYNFFFTDGRITDSFGDVGVGYAYGYSDNTTNLVKLKIIADASNPSLTAGLISSGNTYIASSVLTNGFNAGFSADSLLGYNAQPDPTFGTENGLDFCHIQETNGFWYYVGTSGPIVHVNAINIDYSTPSNSTIDIDYTFLDTNGTTITGHYGGTLGLILD